MTVSGWPSAVPSRDSETWPGTRWSIRKVAVAEVAQLGVLGAAPTASGVTSGSRNRTSAGAALVVVVEQPPREALLLDHHEVVDRRRVRRRRRTGAPRVGAGPSPRARGASRGRPRAGAAGPRRARAAPPRTSHAPMPAPSVGVTVTTCPGSARYASSAARPCRGRAGLGDALRAQRAVGGVLGRDEVLVRREAHVADVDPAEQPVPVAVVGLAAVEVVERRGPGRSLGHRRDLARRPEHLLVEVVDLAVLHLEVAPEPAAQPARLRPLLGDRVVEQLREHDGLAGRQRPLAHLRVRGGGHVDAADRAARAPATATA